MLSYSTIGKLQKSLMYFFKDGDGTIALNLYFDQRESSAPTKMVDNTISVYIDRLIELHRELDKTKKEISDSNRYFRDEQNTLNILISRISIDHSEASVEYGMSQKLTHLQTSMRMFSDSISVLEEKSDHLKRALSNFFSSPDSEEQRRIALANALRDELSEFKKQITLTLNVLKDVSEKHGELVIGLRNLEKTEKIEREKLQELFQAYRKAEKATHVCVARLETWPYQS